MVSLPTLSAVAGLLGAAVLGVTAHELSHAVVLRMAGVRCRVAVLPGASRSGGFSLGARGPLAQVTPVSVPDDVSPRMLRAAAMAPLWLAGPFVLVVAGAVPGGAPGPAIELAAVAWLGCSIPSPQDFSLLWYPERAVAAHRESTTAR